jgi:hypothetical protein
MSKLKLWSLIVVEGFAALLVLTIPAHAGPDVHINRELHDIGTSNLKTVLNAPDDEFKRRCR